MRDLGKNMHPGAYDADYFRKVYRDELRTFSINWWSARFYARICRRILRGDSGGRLLEFGCGQGHILKRLEGHCEAWGVDISEYAIGCATKNAPSARLFCADLAEGLPRDLSEERFDLVLARYVLEHMEDPSAALEVMASALAPGGALLYAVPDLSSPGRKYKGDKWFGFLDETHVSLLEPAEWVAITKKAGFTIEKMFSDGLWDLPYIRGVPRVLQYGLFSLPTIVSVALARPMIPAGKGENLIVIARKIN